MIIQRIKLSNFRSHEIFGIEFQGEMTRIMGRNGCGKTSVLEAIYEAMQGKSFRSVDREILRRGAEFYRIELDYVDGRKIVVVFDGKAEKKDFLVEDKKTRRLPKKAKYPIVLFEPSDLRLVESSPTTRRGYFDRVFAQLSEKYSVALSRYNKALKQRNELLKREDLTARELFPWNVLLVQYGVELRDTRAEEIRRIDEKITEVYRSIADNEDEVGVKYNTEVRSEEEFLRRLEQDFERDRLVGHTSFGVQHDNYEFWFNGSRADGSASRGEVRSMMVALKFIEADLIVEKTGKMPLVLLDDVFSELDEARQKCLVCNFKNNQVILTSVGSGELEVEG